ncbi:MAG: ABC transporter ATP-binding protein [Alphaproteobacteria bacterium]|jgi:branched-chain amino acid transport system ATP-binding protein|nr:ABC transporter ATP-binding protein [Alphaproteobacteria bacterium]MBT4710079.1 ABC transporter ATP-binding protein [Alphaproteobacteria bacterium]MBT5860773.1 ABC transporter ATP-binding protein [Alphaproteobacteria bacterium]
MSSPALEIIGLHKQFGGVAANDGIDLILETGEIHALIGPNGSGKTTLINQIMGILTPNSGEIHVFGQNVAHRPIHTRSKMGVGRSWQIPSVFPDLTVAENVAFGVRAALGLSAGWWTKALTEDVTDRVDKLLGQAGLRQVMDAPAGDLSHADQRKLDVAIALSSDPILVLLDEPLAGLGADETTHMLTYIRKIRANSTPGPKRTIVLIEHDMDAVFALSDRISVLVEGKIVATGTPQEIGQNPIVQHAYLGEA